jgi:hypothetical protein
VTSILDRPIIRDIRIDGIVVVVVVVVVIVVIVGRYRRLQLL